MPLSFTRQANKQRLTSLRRLVSPLSPQDNIVWPAYLSAHRPLFVKGDVENGKIDSSVIDGVELLEASELGMEDMVRRSCETVYELVKSGHTMKDWSKP
jgi:hypothetical protein